MWEVRNITPEDAALYRATIARGFGHDPDSEEGADERFLSIFEPERMLAVFDGDQLVGTGGAITMEVTVPGGEAVPMGGTTVITVQPTHRRRGVLRALMEHHLDDVASRAEPLAGLWASESTIYGRFGYGPATYRYSTTIDAPATRVEGGDVALRIASMDEAEGAMRQVYDAVRSVQVGALSRSEGWWENRILRDEERHRGGKTSMRCVIAERDGAPIGYALYRQQSKWENFVADGEVAVEEVVHVDPAAHAGLWEFLTNIDLFPRVDYWNLPVDDPLSSVAGEARRVKRTISDALWVRVMDVPAALEARRYEIDGAVDFTVTESDSGDESSFRLEVVDGEAKCSPVERGSGLRVGRAALGHLYLGGGNALTLAASGEIEGASEQVSSIHRLFRTDRAPWCPEVF